MRLFAQKKGYTLSDHGLYPTLRTVRNQKVWQGELVPCYTEEEVFKILGLTYKRPD
jgi:DNA polymerase lambda